MARKIDNYNNSLASPINAAIMYFDYNMYIVTITKLEQQLSNQKQK